MDNATAIVFELVILLFSVVIHEVAHGLAANYLGDPTAKYAGRLTLNPVPHLSFFGMVVLPVISFLAWGFPIGAAKPVPYNPYNLKNQRWGPAIVAAAGPFSNLVMAALLGALVRIFGFGVLPDSFSYAFIAILQLVVLINVWLAVVNLIPIPPIDGSKIVYAFLPGGIHRLLALWAHQFKFIFAQYWMFFLVAFFFVGQPLLTFISRVIAPAASAIFAFLTGANPPF